MDLGSLRAGGATFLLLLTEDSELVRRRGRWFAHRTMEIYLQEVSSTVFFPSLHSSVKDRILRLATAFPELLAADDFSGESEDPSKRLEHSFSERHRWERWANVLGGRP